MKNLWQVAAVFVFAIILSGCGGSFNSARFASSNPPSSSLGFDPIVSLSSPADQSYSQGSVVLAGKCTDGFALSVLGDLQNVVDAECVKGVFSATLILSVGDGPKSISVTQFGHGGKTSVASRTFIKDSAAPVMALISPISNQNVRSSVVIQGTCETALEVGILENGATYRIPCANSAFATTFPLSSADGTVSLLISQADRAGNRAETSVLVLKDTVAPAVTIASPLANATVTSQATITGSCETGSSVSVSGSGVAAMAVVNCAGGAYRTPVVFTTGAGSKTVQVSQTDAAGNMASVNRNYTRQNDLAPMIAITAPAANMIFRTTLAVSGTCQTGLMVNFSGAGWLSPATTTCTNGAFSATITFTTGDGTKNLIASQTNAQNLTGSASRSFVRDATAPAVNIASPAAGTISRLNVQLAGACENGIAVQISGTGVVAASTATCTNGAYSTLINFSNDEGAKTISVSQTDSIGNVGSVSRNFVRDSVAPALTIASPAADTSAATGLTVAGTCEGSFAVVASGSGVNSNMTRNCASNAYSFDIVFSSGDGAKTVQIGQTDTAGNVSTVTRNFVRLTPAPVLDGPALYAQNCAACHGALATSAKLNRTASQISLAITSVPLMNSLSSLTAAQREAIASALYVTPTQPAFACEPNQSLESKTVARGIKRLSRRQYLNTLNDLLSRAFSASAASTLVNTALNGVTLPTDDDTVFSRFDASVVRQHMKAYFDVSDTLSNSLTNSTNLSAFVTAFINLDRGTCTSVNAAALTTACANRFIANFGHRALRRPLLATTEVNESTIYLTAYTSAGGGAAGVNAVVFKFLMAPHFLYLIENDGALVSGTLHRLSSHAVAQRLSYMFWNSMPDETLLQQAAAANLSDSAPFATALTYVSDHAKAQDSVREFMNEWLKLNHIPQFQTNNPSLNYLAGGLTLDSSLRTAMIDEVQELGSYVYRNNMTLNDLFLTDVSFARDSRLMNIYGVTTAAPANVTPQNAIRLPAGQRSGLLTRSALLTGGSELANPIKRGIRIRKEILCLTLENPPAELPDALEPPAPNINMTTRQRYDNATRPQACMNCHQHINSLGHGLSNFNSFGRFSNQEPTFETNGMFSGRLLPIDSSVDLGISLGAGLTANNPHELSQLVASHRNTRQCISEKALRFAEGRVDDRAKEGCRLNNLYDHLSQSHSLKDFMKSIAQDLEFRHRLVGN